MATRPRPSNAAASANKAQSATATGDTTKDVSELVASILNSLGDIQRSSYTGSDRSTQGELNRATDVTGQDIGADELLKLAGGGTGASAQYFTSMMMANAALGQQQMLAQQQEMFHARMHRLQGLDATGDRSHVNAGTYDKAADRQELGQSGHGFNQLVNVDEQAYVVANVLRDFATLGVDTQAAVVTLLTQIQDLLSQAKK